MSEKKSEWSQKLCVFGLVSDLFIFYQAYYHAPGSLLGCISTVYFSSTTSIASTYLLEIKVVISPNIKYQSIDIYNTMLKKQMETCLHKMIMYCNVMIRE